MATAPSTLPRVTDDERTMATLAHALQTVGWWIAPLIILLVKRDSRFVRLHAGQALLLQLGMLLVWIVCMVAFFAFFMANIPMEKPPQGTPVGPPPAFFLLFPFIWLGMMSWWVIMLVLAIMHAIKAGRGEWSRYPLLGGLAAKLFDAAPPVPAQPDMQTY